MFGSLWACCSVEGSVLNRLAELDDFHRILTWLKALASDFASGVRTSPRPRVEGFCAKSSGSANTGDAFRQPERPRPITCQIGNPCIAVLDSSSSVVELEPAAPGVVFISIHDF